MSDYVTEEKANDFMSNMKVDWAPPQAKPRFGPGALSHTYDNQAYILEVT